MKLRKVAMLALALTLVLAWSTTAFAAKKDLPKAPNWVNRTEQQGWATDSAYDGDADNLTGTKIGLTLDDLKSAKYLVIELNKPFTNDGTEKIGVSTENIGWADVEFSNLGDENTIKIDLPATSVWSNILEADEWGRFEIQHWTEDWLDIKAIYLDDGVAAAAASGGGGDNPATGETSVIVFAGIALALATLGTVTFSKKARAK